MTGPGAGEKVTVVDLEAATDKALAYLQKAGYPTGVMEVVNTERRPDGGWKLWFQKLFSRDVLEVEVDSRGKVVTLRKVSRDE